MSTPYSIGYARTSTRQQDLGIQRDALRGAGCNLIVEEQASGAKRDRPQLEDALSRLRAGDVFVVWKLDRLARSLEHLIAIVKDLEARGVHFKSLTDGFDTTTISGKMIFHVIGAMAEFERSLIEQRRGAGLAKARAAGKQFGRRSAADPTAKTDKSGRLAKAMQAVQRGSSIASAAKTHGIGRATIRRHMAHSAIDLDQSHSAIVTARKHARNGHLNGHFDAMAELR
jgi:DNA invertase Pin-like site-specific DNA recombinase